MFYLSCHRLGYKLQTLEVWEVFGGKYNTEHLGFRKGFSNKKCKPPVYLLYPKDKDLVKNVELPKGSKVEMWDPFPPRLQGPEVDEILDSKDQKIKDLKSRVKELEAEVGDLEVQVKLVKKQKLAKPIAKKGPKLDKCWKISYNWVYGEEIYWDFKTKKDAEEHLQYIKGFYGARLVESITNEKIESYFYKIDNTKGDKK